MQLEAGFEVGHTLLEGDGGLLKLDDLLLLEPDGQQAGRDKRTDAWWRGSPIGVGNPGWWHISFHRH